MNLLPRASSTTRRLTAIALTIVALSTQGMARLGHAAPSHIPVIRSHAILQVAFTAGPDSGKVLMGDVSVQLASTGQFVGSLKVSPEENSLLPGGQYISVNGALATASNHETAHLTFYVGQGQELQVTAASAWQDGIGQVSRAATQPAISTVAVVSGPNSGDVASFALCFGRLTDGVCTGLSISTH